MEALRLVEETGAPAEPEEQVDDSVKVATPVEQKTSGGKKKKTPAEVVLMLGKRKGWKHVTIVYGLDLFGIKLKDAAKAAKRKFATGSSLTMVCLSCPSLMLRKFDPARLCLILAFLRLTSSRHIFHSLQTVGRLSKFRARDRRTWQSLYTQNGEYVSEVDLPISIFLV